MSGVVRAIKKPLKKVEKKLKEEILDPVVNVVEDVGRAMKDDPLTAIATIGAYATGNAWAVPLINGASTVAKGGDLGDVAKSIAISAIAPTVVGKVSAVASNAITNLGVSAGASTAVGNIVGKTVVSAATGADLKTALLGGISGEIAKTSTKYFNEAVPNFDKLSKSQQNSVNTAITTFISSGGNINEGILAGVASSITDSIDALSPKTAQFNEAIVAATKAGLQGQDSGAAFIGSLNSQGAAALGDKVKTYFETPRYDMFGDKYDSKARRDAADKTFAEQEIAAQADIEKARVAADIESRTTYAKPSGSSYDASFDPEEAMGEKTVPLTEAEKADVKSRTVLAGESGSSIVPTTAEQEKSIIEKLGKAESGNDRYHCKHVRV